MEEVRQLVQEEGREARNLVAFHVAVENPNRISRKPPRASPVLRRATPRPATRLRSASAGRDKRSDLRARYWALLFGDLRRVIGEIYNIVEAHDNLSECQEVILVLENYTRDFKALAEWFRLKWDYDNTPPPLRPQSLAWEIRKTDFVRLESRRAYSVKSSPSVSGKNSPCLSGHNTPSGKNSPNLTGKASPGSGKISPRITGHSNTTSPKANIEFFSNKIASKITAKPEPKSVLEVSRLSDIKEKESTNLSEEIDVSNNNNISHEPLEVKEQPTNELVVELGKAKEYPNTCPKLIVIKSPKRTVLAKEGAKITSSDDISSQAKATIAKLDAMENEFLSNHLTENVAKNDNQLNLDKENDTHAMIVSETNNDAMIVSETNNDAMIVSETNNDAMIFNETNNDAMIDSETNNDAMIVSETNNDAIIVSETNNDANILEKTSTDDKESSTTESPVKSEYNFGDVSNESSCKSPDSVEKNILQEERATEENKIDIELDTSVLKVINMDQDSKIIEFADNTNVSLNNESVKDIPDRERSKDNGQTDIKDVKKDTKTVIEKLPTRPAYSQAAAKPKPITASKPEVKNQTRIVTRSKTVIEIRPNTSQKNPNRTEPRNRNQTNRCSYPFNLTTGRTNLFGAPNKTNLSKRPVNRMQQSGSGDNKGTPKLDTRVRKRPPRPTSLKINETGDKKEIDNIALENIKDCDEYGSSETIIPQRDVSRIESSESLKTLVPDDIGNSIEVLNVEKIKGDDDGWLTVKSRRLSRESKKQFKSHWSNRFHQPSATTSLPTLNMMESPKQETKEIIANKKLDRAKSEQPENIALLKQCNSHNKIQPTKEEPKINDTSKPDIVVIKPFDNTRDVPKGNDCLKLEDSPKSNAVLKSKAEEKETKKDLAMIRQKSDVTGLKTRSSRTKVLKKDKIKDTPKSDGSELTKNRLHSSLESLTTGLARSQESTRETFDFDKWKAEFKSTFKFLEDDDQIPNHNEILKTADPSEMSEIAEMTSLIEENERKISWALDFQSEVDQQKLCEEEDLLNRQIMELQQVSDIDMDTETDDTETDAEILCEDNSACITQSTENLASLTASLEDQYETALAGMSWAERVDTLGALEALVARDPGRAQQLHAKLSQGIKRRGSLQDALRRLQAKQARAERQRNEYQTERARKIHQLLAKVEEVKVAKNQLIEEKRLRMERRLQKAAENRDQHLKDIVRKAHDEEEKLREIAFIKQLEAENRRHEFLDQCRSHTTRLRLMRRDRLSKLEQKAAREAAVGARRQALEAARKLHVETLLEKRKERDARVEELKELKKQERDDAAREKAEGVKSRLSALAAAAELEADALRSRIRDKQDASQQRLESHLQAIREKATGPRQPTTSESQEKELEEAAARLEQERKDREKQKAIKKKARKVKQKLLASSCEKCHIEESTFDHNTPYSSRTSKVINTIQHLIAPLLDSTENESKPNGVDHDEPEKKKNKKNKKIVNGDVEKKPESNNNKEIENNQDEVKSEGKKRRKRNNCNDKPKLTKSGSVCSSLSDMSRGSGKGEKSRTVIDIQYLERQLNELHRIIDKFDKTAIDKSSVQKLHGVKVLGQFLAVAAEREDLASQITVRCVTTCVVMVSRALATCALSAAHFLSSNTCVHIVKLLSDQLEKDLQSDPKEMELAKQLGDCLSIALDSVLCSTRLYEDSKDVSGEELEVLATLRARAHTLISYLCLCGCITRAEKAGAARESIQTLLTVCADLCHPCDIDVGSERASATQSLRCALGTSVCGSRAEFCVLFAQGAGLEHSGGFVKAARTTHLLRALAELDHQIVQDAFGEGGWPLEFRAAVARLLSQHAPNDKEAPRSIALRLSNQRLDQTLSETMVLDLIVLVGFVIVNNPQLQETICDGWSVIKTLCTLPANWLVSRLHSHVLLPTLVVLSDHSGAAAAIASELSTGMLEEYMKSPEAQKVKLVQVIKQGRSKKGKK